MWRPSTLTQCVRVSDRESETERVRESERETESERKRERDREEDRATETESDQEKERQRAKGQREREREKEKEREGARKTTSERAMQRLTECNQVLARGQHSANAKEPHVHCRLDFVLFY